MQLDLSLVQESGNGHSSTEPITSQVTNTLQGINPSYRRKAGHQGSRQAILRPSLLLLSSKSNPPAASPVLQQTTGSGLPSSPLPSPGNHSDFLLHTSPPHPFVSVTNSRNPLTKRSRVGDLQVFGLPPTPKASLPLSSQTACCGLLLCPHSQGTKQILYSLNLQSQLILITVNTRYLEKHSTWNPIPRKTFFLETNTQRNNLPRTPVVTPGRIAEAFPTWQLTTS